MWAIECWEGMGPGDQMNVNNMELAENVHKIRVISPPDAYVVPLSTWWSVQMPVFQEQGWPKLVVKTAAGFYNSIVENCFQCSLYRNFLLIFTKACCILSWVCLWLRVKPTFILQFVCDRTSAFSTVWLSKTTTRDTKNRPPPTPKKRLVSVFFYYPITFSFMA